jgi:hydrogenase maturation factor HypF (carbamoyltransferase family)
MTIYGGEVTTWGSTHGGFFVICTKCGWHSRTTINYAYTYEYAETGSHAIVFHCDHCDNEYTQRE